MPAIFLVLPLTLASQNSSQSERPKLPYNMMGLGHDEIDAYDSKAEPVADATAALVAMNRTGWELIHENFPRMGAESAGEAKRVHPEDPMDAHFFASYANEDATFSPIPLLSAIASLPASEVSVRLRTIHDEAVQAITPDSFSEWKLEDLRRRVESLTNAAKTTQGVKYRTPKSGLSFAQASRLYAMTLALLRMENKWAGKADSPPPNMADFTSRLRHQLPRLVRDGETAGFFFYRPGTVSHALSKKDFEERADVVLLSRAGNVFRVQQFPVYLTVNQKEWSPAWIEAKDEASDSTLLARKFEHDWTRLDGPYLWYLPDQLNGQVLYRATVEFASDQIVIEAERDIESRGAVKRAERPRDYDPLRMTPFSPGTDAAALPSSPLSIESPAVDVQLATFKRPPRYFSNSFRAWCAYGISTSGLASDGRTWVSIAPDQPRPSSVSAGPSRVSGSTAHVQPPAQQ